MTRYSLLAGSREPCDLLHSLESTAGLYAFARSTLALAWIYRFFYWFSHCYLPHGLCVSLRLAVREIGRLRAQMDLIISRFDDTRCRIEKMNFLRRKVNGQRTVSFLFSRQQHDETKLAIRVENSFPVKANEHEPEIMLLFDFVRCSNSISCLEHAGKSSFERFLAANWRKSRTMMEDCWILLSRSPAGIKSSRCICYPPLARSLCFDEEILSVSTYKLVPYWTLLGD